MVDSLTQDERIAGGGAAVAAIATLLPWYHVDQTSSSLTANGFGAGLLGDLVFLCAAAMLLVILARAELVDIGERALDARVPIALGGLALGAIVVQLLIGIDGRGPLHHAAIGIVVALVGVMAMAGGGYMVGAAERVQRRQGASDALDRNAFDARLRHL